MRNNLETSIWQDDIYRDNQILLKAKPNPELNKWFTANYNRITKKCNNIEHINTTYMYLTYKCVPEVDFEKQFIDAYYKLLRHRKIWNIHNQHRIIVIDADFEKTYSPETEVS